jgi:dolichol-phosphate mannosyltransferase
VCAGSVSCLLVTQLARARRRTLSILVPAYQEERTIVEVLRRVLAADTGRHGFDKEVIVCDDGSTDRTAELVAAIAARDARVRLIRHAHNQGKGASIRSSLRIATGDVCLVQDADLEYDIADYPAILRAVAGGARVVFGSRFMTRRVPEGMRAANWLANKILTLTANLLYGVRITDEATCFKIVETALLRSLELECDSFDFCPEVTAKIGLRGVPIVEVPVAYRARRHEDGKKIRWTHAVEAMWALLKYRLPRPRVSAPRIPLLLESTALSAASPSRPPPPAP